MSDTVVHGVGYGGHGDIELRCGKWVEAAWNQPDNLPTGVYLGENDDWQALYTFEASLVTCPECLSRGGSRP